MKSIPYKWPVLGLFLFVLILLAWWIFGSDPRAFFLGKVNKMIEQVNQGEHLALRKKLSPEMESYIADNFTEVQQALLLAHKIDTEGHYHYRLVQIDVFEAKKYAEVELERSGPGGDFSAARRFPVPFVYRDGEWLVAGGFQGDREFVNPFY